MSVPFRERTRRAFRAGCLTATAALMLAATPTQAAVSLFNAATTADNATTRANWLAAIGIASPQFLVNFESGFVNNQDISGVGGLFPAGLIIDDTSPADAVLIQTGAGSIGGSNPVGNFSATHNEAPSLVLDFSASPVDYVGFLEIDQASTSGVITFVGGATANFNLDTTGSGGNIEEFFGIWRNDQPRIVSVAMNASGDGEWGIDNIEYGTVPAANVAPEPGSLALCGTVLAGGWAARRRKRR
jgi:hypothetical protein